jgi:protein-S-isoprenylcysteine O-methyltransferase Ste14
VRRLDAAVEPGKAKAKGGAKSTHSKAPAAHTLYRPFVGQSKAARRPRRRNMSWKPRKSIGNRIRLLMHIPVPWVFILAYFVGVGLEWAFSPHIRKEELRGITVAGAGVFVAGAVIAGWSLLIFHKARTTTVPGRASAKLVTSGPYRISRNPMYVGLTLAYLGEAGLLKQLWPLIVLPLVLAYINSIVIPVEEARLKEVFGEDYGHYCSRTRRWI